MLQVKLCTDESAVDKRFDVYLSEMIEEISRRKAKDIILANQAQVNGAIKKPSFKLSENLYITCDVPDVEEQEIIPENIPCHVCYEDEYLAIINKPTGMLTHPTTYETSGTLVNSLLWRYGKENLSTVNGVFRPGIIHRLDRDTSGLLLIAKNNESHLLLSEMIQRREITRQYLAVVIGNLVEDEGCINLPIGRSISKVKMDITSDGREAVTFWKVLERLCHQYTLVEATLATGRTHQIRVHLSHKGNPVVGDPLYGGGNVKKVKLAGQALQSYKISLLHPVTQKELSLTLPPDEKITKCLKGFTNNNSQFLQLSCSPA